MRPRAALGLVLGLPLAAAFAACGLTDDAPPPTGAVDIGFVQVGAHAVKVVTYEISGNGIEPITGTIDLSDDQATPSAIVGGIPPGSGYVVELSARTDDGQEQCDGMATFDVIANQSATADLSVTCTPDVVKTIQVNGMTDYCPTLASDSASPPAGLVGGPPITLAASGRSYYSDPLMFIWEASSGQLATPNTSVSLYTCTEPGRHELTVTVTDGNCPDSASLFVTCLPASDAGTDASGDVRGEVGGML